MIIQKRLIQLTIKFLLRKIVHLNFPADVISWFKLYLAGRTFKVYDVNEYFFSPGYLTWGVSQGSIHYFFLLYINGMPESVSSDLFLYADDCVLFFNIKT